MSKIRPIDHQPQLDQDHFIRRETPNEDEAIPMDVVFVGGGPAGLSGAIEHARLIKEDNEKGGGLGEIEIAVLEKAGEIGQHSLSGAVMNPRALRELFPGRPDSEFPFLRTPVSKEAVYLLGETSAKKLPTPPTMKNHGNFVASLCEMVRWLGGAGRGARRPVFPGFPVDSLLMDDEQGRSACAPFRPGSTATATRAARTSQPVTSPRA